VSAEATDPRFAQRLVNAWASEVVAFRRETDRARVSEAIQLVEDDLSGQPEESEQARRLRERLEELQILQSLQTGGVEFLQRANVSDEPVGYGTATVAVAALLAGCALGCALALLAGRLDRRLTSVEAAATVLDLPLLGAVPHVRPRRNEPMADRMDPGLVEGYRTIAVRLSFFNVDRPLQALLVTSGVAGEGKTTIALGLARALAADGSRTLLLECDLRQGSLVNVLALPIRAGLTEVVANQATLGGSVRTIPQQPAWAGAVDVLCAGLTPPNPLQMLTSERFSALLRDVRHRYDYVVLDTPPILQVSDALTLLDKVDGFVLVTRVRYTLNEALRRSRDLLEPSRQKALGVVVNGVQAREGGYGYGYGYGSPPERSSGQQVQPEKSESFVGWTRTDQGVHRGA
jgi:capsular exopolysaccharide synthesis family protein